MSTPSTPLSATARLVPGAPPPAPGSKTQKRKKTKSKKPSEQGEEPTEVPDAQTAALITQAPSEGDVKEGTVAPELIVRSTSTRPVSPSGDDKDGKVTALVDMLNKRLKATNKKVIRIQGYSTTPVDKLNEDQLRSLKTLPVLEGIVKELEEVKKAVEVHEAEVALEVSKIKAEAAKAEEERVQDAVASAISLHRLKTADLLSLISLHAALTNGNPTALALNLSETEAYAVFSAVESLLGSDPEKKAEVIRGFLSAEGEYQGVSYARLIGITELFTHPPPPPEPEAPEPEVVVEFVAAEEPAQELEVVIQGVPASAGVGGSFTFVQEDELEVEQEEAEPSDDDVEIIQTVTEADVAGHHIVQESLTITTTHEEPAPADNAGINWADEEDHGLPSIASLHDRFGSSSTGTPVPGQEPLPETPITPAATHGANTEDGFQHASRGRGRGRGGFRGGERGGYRGFRGGERGGFRGGERGGRGGWRGGDRGGERGGWRGRGRGEGDWRGGDGEHRGRGRGRGRGGFHDARGGGAPPPVAA